MPRILPALAAIAALLACTFAAPAGATDWAAPVLTDADLPGLSQWRQLSDDYWAGVPGVPSRQDACGPDPVTVRAVSGTGQGAWGAPRTDGAPCGIWYDREGMIDVAYLAAWQLGREQCRAYVHEDGHTRGLGHDFTGDPVGVMRPGAGYPAGCVALYPEPPAAPLAPEPEITVEVTADEPHSPVRCIPAWVLDDSPGIVYVYWRQSLRIRSHRRALELRARARHVHQRWAARHRPAARRARHARPTCAPLSDL